MSQGNLIGRKQQKSVEFSTKINIHGNHNYPQSSDRLNKVWSLNENWAMISSELSCFQLLIEVVSACT